MVSSAIVNILNTKHTSVGTGFFVSADGNIVTCNHVLVKAGYNKVGQTVKYKKENELTIYDAILIKICEKDDVAIIQAIVKNEFFIPFCDRDPSSETVECYGYPNSSMMQIKATVLFERCFNNDSKIQLGKANSITNGFSGSPVIYNDASVGIVDSVTKMDKNGRMTEVAFAISAKRIIELLPRYISKKEICTGYAKELNKCINYVVSKVEGLCELCFENQFVDAVKALYNAQNFIVHQFENYFITELKYGISTYFDAIFTIVRFGDLITRDDLMRISMISSESDFHVSQTIIVTNAKLNSESEAYAKSKNITVRTKEELLRTLFNFTPYCEDLSRYVNSEQLASHYIDVYGTEFFEVEEDKQTRQLPIKNEKEYILFDEDEEDDDSFELTKRLYSRYDETAEWGYESSDDDIYNEYEEYYENEDASTDKMLMKDYVDIFLSSKHRALLILGEYGSGKTSFCYTYALSLLKGFLQGKSIFLPILVKLRSYNKAVGIGQLLTDYFVNDLGINNFNLSSLKLLLKNLNVVLIFDGYDEVAKKVDFDVKYEVLREVCSLVENNTKIILTCRPNYFQSGAEFKRIFEASHFKYEPGEKPVLKFIENSIAELTSEQINKYIGSYQAELDESKISIVEMILTIANTHDLTDLSKRPFLLYMILQTLPEILKDVRKKGDTKINAAKLYAVYTDNWIKREDSKNKTLIDLFGN